jgi:tRNA(adenine34) deaminase
LRAAAKHLKNYRLNDCDVYVTLEPCPMCLGAMLYARVRHVYFGAYDKKLGACESVFQLHKARELNHRLHCEGGFYEAQCQALLRDFFRAKR